MYLKWLKLEYKKFYTLSKFTFLFREAKHLPLILIILLKLLCKESIEKYNNLLIQVIPWNYRIFP